MKNVRKHNRRAVLRARRQGTAPNVIMTIGHTLVKVTPSIHQPRRAAYYTRNATVFGPWPPDAVTTHEIHRWS